MSLNKRATHRLSLLAGSSLIAAGLASAAALAPSVASAQAVCSPAPSSGGGTNSVIYNAGTYNPGITCTASGGAMNVSTAGAITVSATGGVPLDPLVNGVNLVGGTQNVTWTSTAGGVTGGAQTNGPVIDATTSTGAISITTGAVTATAAGTTHAIRATATGAGDIAITRQAAVINNNVPTSINAIEAVTNGGDISYTANGNGATTGRLRGILAQTNGAGGVTMSLNGGNINSSATEGIAAVDVIAGMGGVDITMNGGFTLNFNGGTGAAIRVASASAVVLNGQAGTINGRVDFSGVTAGGVTLNLTGGRWSALNASVFSGLADTVNIESDSSLAAGGSLNFGAGADRFNVNGAYTANAGTIAFGTGDDRFDVAGTLTANGVLVDFGADADTLDLGGLLISRGATLDFGAGDDTLNLTGAIAMNGLTINNIEAFNNTGAIFMGGTSGDATDDAVGDILTMTGGTYTGLASARVVLDIIQGGGVQIGCVTAAVSDCLDLRGASTAGVTLLTLNDVNPNPATQGGYDPMGITLVDVGGAGSSAASHFALDPSISGYATDRTLGGVVTRPGLFAYRLEYDADNQRHILVGLPRSEVMEYAVLGGAAQSIWHMSSQAVTDRQTDLRTGAEGAMWLRASGEYSKRDVVTSLESGTGLFEVDNGYKLYAGQVMGGIDLITGRSGAYDYVVGVQLGYVTSSFDFDDSPSSGRFTGASGGAYGSVWSDHLFIDATFNTTFLTLDYASPGLASKTNSYLNSVGAQIEGGVRAMLTERMFVEPLVTLAYVRTTFEEISLTGGEVTPDDVDSRRGGLGLRVGADLRGGPVNVSYYVTGKVWNEFEGQSSGVVANPGIDLPYADDFRGSFGEAQLGVNLYNDANTFSGFLASGVKFKDGYDAVDLSLGVRMRW